ASTAMPTPVAPPPTITRSQGSRRVKAQLNISGRFILFHSNNLPVFCPVQGSIPSSTQSRGLRLGDQWVKEAPHSPLGGDFLRVPPETHRKPGQIGCAESCSFSDAGTNNRNSEKIGLELHHQIVLRRPAVDSKLLEFHSRVGSHRVQKVRDLVSNPFQ